jgi:hypothetical protein
MKSTSLRFGPFLGPITSLDASEIPKLASSSTQDCRYEDGVLRSRYGYTSILAAQASTTATHGLSYLSGYNSSYAAVRELVSFEKVSAKIHPWSLDPSSYARTEIKNGATSVDLYDAAWRTLSFDSDSYFFCPDAAATTQLYRHAIGTATSLTAIASPAAPAARPGYQLIAKDFLELAGLAPSNGAEVAVTGLASNTNSSLVGTAQVAIRHTAGTGPASMEMIMSGTTTGLRDWYWKDAFSMTIWSTNQSLQVIDPATLVVTLSNDDGTPVTFTPTVEAKRDAYGYIRVRCWWDSGKTRANWGNGSGTGKLAKIKIAYNVTKGSAGTGSANSEVNFMVDGVGWTRTLPTTAVDGVLELAYSYYDSTTDLESELSPVTSIPYGDLGLPNPNSFTYDSIGRSFNVTFVSTGAVDKVRIYAKDTAGNWRRITTVDDLLRSGV